MSTAGLLFPYQLHAIAVLLGACLLRLVLLDDLSHAVGAGEGQVVLEGAAGDVLADECAPGQEPRRSRHEWLEASGLPQGWQCHKNRAGCPKADTQVGISGHLARKADLGIGRRIPRSVFAAPKGVPFSPEKTRATVRPMC